MIVELIKYIATGIFNTTVGLGTIFALMYFAINPYLANIIGYVLGLMVSFFLQKKWVFQAHKNGSIQFIHFLINFVVSYSINILVLWMLLMFSIDKFVATLISSGFYVAVFYCLSKYWVFKK